MIRHVFALIWKRKGSHALIILELLVMFLILFALAGFTLHLYQLYNKPLGFNVGNTWSVGITKSGALTDADSETFREVLAVAEQMEEVTKVGLMYDLPFDLGGSATSVTVGDMNQGRVDMTVVTPDLPQAIGLQLVEGRWFGPEDDAEAVTGETISPVIVNRAFSEAAGGNLVGKLFPNGQGGQGRIVGVFDEFRQHGQFSGIRPVMIQRLRVEGTFFEAPRIVLILKPGVPADFEERLLRAFQGSAPGWDFDVDTWASLEELHFNLYTIPLMIAGGLVLFLLAMVGFGMLGVLWQNVIRRTPEMGLRRAMGASAGAVRLQVVLEMLAVALFAVVLGIAIVVQFPLSGILQALDWELFIPAATLSTTLLFGLCVLFALYPSYQATRQDPVEALRYE